MSAAWQKRDGCQGENGGWEWWTENGIDWELRIDNWEWQWKVKDERASGVANVLVCLLLVVHWMSNSCDLQIADFHRKVHVFHNRFPLPSRIALRDHYGIITGPTRNDPVIGCGEIWAGYGYYVGVQLVASSVSNHGLWVADQWSVSPISPVRCASMFTWYFLCLARMRYSMRWMQIWLYTHRLKSVLRPAKELVRKLSIVASFLTSPGGTTV